MEDDDYEVLSDEGLGEEEEWAGDVPDEEEEVWVGDAPDEEEEEPAAKKGRKGKGRGKGAVMTVSAKIPQPAAKANASAGKGRGKGRGGGGGGGWGGFMQERAAPPHKGEKVRAMGLCRGAVSRCEWGRRGGWDRKCHGGRRTLWQG